MVVSAIDRQQGAPLLGYLKCRFVRHRSPNPYFRARNGMIIFGNCSRCGERLIHYRGVWRPIPRRFRLVWKVRSQASKLARDIADGRMPL